jgi:predicted aspartyl protease
MCATHNMLFNIFLITTLTFSVSDNSLYASPSTPSHPFKSLGYVNNKNFNTTLEVQWSGGLPLIDVVINDKPYTFLFDTGAPTIIPDELIKQLDITPIKTETFFAASGRKHTKQIYQFPSVKIGDIEFRDFAVIAADFSDNFPLSCIGFDGIFGYNFMRDLIVTLNLEKDAIILSDQPPDSTGYIETEMRFEEDYMPKIRLNFAFGEAWFGLDTGNNSEIDIGDPAIISALENRGYRSRKTVGIYLAEIGGANTNMEEISYLVNNFSIDEKIPVDSMPIHINNGGLSLIGNKLLKRFSIIADFPKKKAYLKPLVDEDIAVSFKDTFGFKPFWSEENKLFVSAIIDHTPAYHSRMEIGDSIISINNEDTSNFSVDESCNMLRMLGGDEESYDDHKTLEIAVKKSSGEIKSITLEK